MRGHASDAMPPWRSSQSRRRVPYKFRWQQALQPPPSAEQAPSFELGAQEPTSSLTAAKQALLQRVRQREEEYALRVLATCQEALGSGGELGATSTTPYRGATQSAAPSSAITVHLHFGGGGQPRLG